MSNTNPSSSPDFEKWDKLSQVDPSKVHEDADPVEIPATPRPPDTEDYVEGPGGIPLVAIPSSPSLLAAPGTGAAAMAVPLTSAAPSRRQIKFREMDDREHLPGRDDEHIVPKFHMHPVDVHSIVKLGGAFLTNKSVFESLNEAGLYAVAAQIAEAHAAGQRLLIVQGAGSFGHAIAQDYKLSAGLGPEGERGEVERRLIGVAKTRESVSRLNSLVVRALVAQGVPAVGVAPSSVVHSHAGCIFPGTFSPLVSVIKRMLRMGLVPVIHGDVVPDTAQGCSVLSGDTITVGLTRAFSPKRVMFVSNVQGLFDKHPDVPGAELLPEFEFVCPDDGHTVDLSGVKFAPPPDAKVAADISGTMQGKLHAACECAMKLPQGIVYIMEGGTESLGHGLKGDEIPAGSCTKLVVRPASSPRASK